jgi:hypothetical protein
MILGGRVRGKGEKLLGSFMAKITGEIDVKFWK